MTLPFERFLPQLPPASAARESVTAAARTPEPEAVPPLLDAARLSPELSTEVQRLAERLATGLRERKVSIGRAGIVQSLLQEFALSSQEGIALMCLAEALLRIPDEATRDALIRDKISGGRWEDHLGRSPSLFVNAATWGLLLTGKLVATHSESGLSSAVGRAISAGGEPLIRKGVDMALRMMGEQFVTGETIGQALRNASRLEAEGFRYSYDMLGEAAMTAGDATRYLHAYENAIHAIGKASAGRGIYAGPGISIKLSALHPRYSFAQYERVMGELYPDVLALARLAKRYDIGLNIDAEEAERLEVSLDLLERLCVEPSLAGWNGLGFVVQAYQKRCARVVDYLAGLARDSGRRLMVRLVKGAYWDSEIKRAQLDGQEGYPVFTRKAYTDLSYIACAKKLLAAPAELYPQFATHNAQTVAAIYHLAGPGRYTEGQYEFQCLHGMGEPLYEQVVGELGRPCRIYAPVGTHETLLAYLVRRLLENGANTSFVNRIADASIPIGLLVADPVKEVERMAKAEGGSGLPHPAIPLPRDLYGKIRRNSGGIDLANRRELEQLVDGMRASVEWVAAPMLGVECVPGDARPVRNPANHTDVVGRVHEATAQDVDTALRCATQAASRWAALAASERAAILERAADEIEIERAHLMGLLVREAGKTAANALSEVREAVDFLRYYAGLVSKGFASHDHMPLGPVACISPWNFPLAIFAGQVAAALAAGNTVLAKPAEQTPLIAAEAVRLLWRAGIPRDVLQLLPGRGEVVGDRLVTDERVKGVLFTGSIEVARILQRAVAGRLDENGHGVPLIAETGGQNAMIVDSSALAEQVVADVVASAFDSAGQRCSALRVLCVQEDAADRILEMLRGAMAELRIGMPDRLSTDVGPVIDAEAKAIIEKHLEAMRARGRPVHTIASPDSTGLEGGTYVLPSLVEIESVVELEREVFGPVLHFVRYRREALDELLAQINATGYGLTLGLHTRIDETIDRVVGLAHAGNVYVNRNMVGAVVGVQPFGGEGLSGTGPKAGGPLYLYRLLSRGPDDVLARVFEESGKRFELPLRGPTGELNTYSVVPREAVLCLAEREEDLQAQLAAVLAVGSRPVREPSGLEKFDQVLFHGSAQRLIELRNELAQRPGPIVGVEGLRPGEPVPLERLVVERALSINTAAAGGNASLMTIG